MQKHIQIFFIINLQFYIIPIGYITFGIKSNKKIILIGNSGKQLSHPAINSFLAQKNVKNKYTVLLENENNIYFNILKVLKTIKSIENNTQKNTDYNSRKSAYYNMLNVTIEDYYNYINSCLKLFVTLAEEYPELKGFIKEAYKSFHAHMTEFENLITNSQPSDNILKLILEKHENCNNCSDIAKKIQAFIEFISYANYEVIQVGFIVGILNSLKTHNTVILICKNIHVIKIALYLVNQYPNIVSIESTNLD